LLTVLAEPGLRLAARGWASILGNLPLCEASIEDTLENPKGSFVNSCIIFDGSGTHEGLIALTRRSIQSQTESAFLKFPRNDWVLVWEADIPGAS
jgi:hypothetical protein